MFEKCENKDYSRNLIFQVKQAFREPGKQMPQIWEALCADVNIFPGKQYR